MAVHHTVKRLLLRLMSIRILLLKITEFAPRLTKLRSCSASDPSGAGHKKTADISSAAALRLVVFDGSLRLVESSLLCPRGFIG